MKGRDFQQVESSVVDFKRMMEGRVGLRDKRTDGLTEWVGEEMYRMVGGVSI